MPGGVQDDKFAAGDGAVNEFAHLLRGDDVLAALQDQRRDIHLGEIGAVVRLEGNAGERLGDFGIGAAKAVGEFLPSSGRSGLPMIAGAICADQPR